TALVALAALTVAARRRWPLAIFAVALLAESGAIILGYERSPFIAVTLVLYIVALRFPRRTSAVVLALAVVTTLGAVAASPDVVEERSTWTSVLGRIAVGAAGAGASGRMAAARVVAGS